MHLVPLLLVEPIKPPSFSFSERLIFFVPVSPFPPLYLLKKKEKFTHSFFFNFGVVMPSLQSKTTAHCLGVLLIILFLVASVLSKEKKPSYGRGNTASSSSSLFAEFNKDLLSSAFGSALFQAQSEQHMQSSIINSVLNWIDPIRSFSQPLNNALLSRAEEEGDAEQESPLTKPKLWPFGSLFHKVDDKDFKDASNHFVSQPDLSNSSSSVSSSSLLSGKQLKGSVSKTGKKSQIMRRSPNYIDAQQLTSLKKRETTVDSLDPNAPSFVFNAPQFECSYVGKMIGTLSNFCERSDCRPTIVISFSLSLYFLSVSSVVYLSSLSLSLIIFPFRLSIVSDFLFS